MTARLDVASEIDAALAALDLPEEPHGLYAPVRFVLAGGGKRVRPALVLLAAEAFGGDDARQRALPAALGVEVFHNCTLVHDALMDHAATRRGRPTVHERWDVPTAILAGDLLMGLAADLVAQAGTGDVPRLMAAHYRMTARLCEGQTLDMAFERRGDVTVGEYLDMIDRKTGALLQLAVELGAIIGGANDSAVESLRDAGRALGRAFQIQDDLLDLTADPETFGKPIGGDLVAGKRTYLVLKAREAEPEAAWLAEILDGGLARDRVGEARERLAQIGVLDAAVDAVARYTADARAALDVLPDGPAADALRQLALGLASRRL